MTSNHAECAECRAIREEFVDAARELEASPKRRGDVRAAGEALLKMLGGTDEDAENAETLLGRFRPQVFGGPEAGEPDSLCPRLRDAYQRMLKHRWRTGHMALLLR